jgi:hypothetical protein
MSITRFRYIPGLLASAIVLASAAPVVAQQEPSQQPSDAAPAAAPTEEARAAARTAYQEGEKAFATGDFATAVAKFKQAHELLPTPHTAYWIAVSLDRQKLHADAALAYEALLADADAARIGDERLSQVRTRHEELSKLVYGQLALTTVPSARITVDGEAKGQTPVELRLRTGVHQLTLEADGYLTEQVELKIVPGQTLSDTLELKPVPKPPAPPPAATPAAPAPRAAPERSLVPGYVMLGLTAASAGAGAYFGIRALSSKSDFDDAPTESTADDVERFQMLSDVAFGAALTFGITAVVFLTSSPSAAAKPSPSESARLSLTPMASRHGGGAAARFRF